MSGEGREIRCSTCGYIAPAAVAWGINALCPRCLSLLSTGKDAASPVEPAMDRQELETVVSGWVEAHNDRDLEGMLARMSPRVDFHPLRLSGVDGSYHGHDGVRQWFEQILAGEREHRLEITEFRDAGENRIIALGNLRLDHRADPAPFWALDRFSGGLIVAAHHYLTDADMLEHGRLFDL